MDPVATAAAWVLGRLRADAEAGLWSALRGLVQGDPLTAALNKITHQAIGSAVRAMPGGSALTPDEIGHVVRVFDSVWPTADIRSAPGETLLGRLVAITTEAVEACAEPVTGLGGSFETPSPLSTLEHDLGVSLDPAQYAVELAYAWQLGVRDAAIMDPRFGALANEINSELGHRVVDAARDDIIDALAELSTVQVARERLDGIEQRLDQVLEYVSPNSTSPDIKAKLREITELVQEGILLREAGVELQVLIYREGSDR